MLTPAQIEQYRRDGFLVVSGLFTPAELDELEAAFDGVVQRRLAARAELDVLWAGDWKDSLGAMTLLHTHDVQAYDAAWTRWLLHDHLTSAMADVLGSPNVQLHHTKLFQKPPANGGAFPMHQDYPYFPHQQHTMTAGIIHLTDTDETMGCVRCVPGSHRNGPLTPYRQPNGGVQNWYLDPRQYPIDDATPALAKRGDVVFFNYLTIHGSGPNRSDRARKTVLVQFRDPSDRPTRKAHEHSNAQGMMLRGINPLANWAGNVVEDKTTERVLAAGAPAGTH